MCFGCLVFSGEGNLPDWQTWTDHPVRKEYDIIMDLGEGAFSQVVLAQSKKDSNEYVALKVVFLQSPEMQEDPEHVAIMRREAEFLQMLDHPNIVEVYDVVENEKQMVIMMEWLRGGHLLDKLEEMAGQHYSEQQAAILFVQLADALKHMHSYNIINRDIKAENIVFKDTASTAAAKGVPPIVKFIDLGMAMMYDKDHPKTGALGSPGFVAPEVIMHQEHTFAMDVFSLGVVLFIMLVGRKPFNIKECENLSYCNLDIKDAPGLQDSRWLDLSPAAQALLMGMLEYNPAKRLTSKQVCEQEWVVTRGGLVPRLLHPNVARGAANVASVRRLRNLVHGAKAFKRLQGQVPAGRELEQSVRARNEMTRILQRRRPSDLTSLHSIAMRLNGRALMKKHDQGQTAEPERDLSVRGGRQYTTSKVGNYYTVHGTSQAMPFLLKPSGTAILLSEVSSGSTDASMQANFLHKSSSATLLELATGGSLPEFAPQKRGPIKGTELLKVISTDLKDLLGGPSKSPNESVTGSSPSTSGGKGNFLQRLSSQLKDISSRGYRKGEKGDPSVRNGQIQSDRFGSPGSSMHEVEAQPIPQSGGVKEEAMRHAYSAPVRVLRMKPLKDEDSLSELQSSVLPNIQEGAREGIRESLDVRPSMDVQRGQGLGTTVETPLMRNSAAARIPQSAFSAS